MLLTDTTELWPSQDGVDRSRSFAIIAILSFDFQQGGALLPDDVRWALGAEVGPRLEAAANDAVRKVLHPAESPRFQVDHYQVGPMAEGFAPYFIVTIWDNRDSIASTLSILANAWAITEISRQVKQRLSSWIRSFGNPRLSVSVSFPPEALEQFCIAHVRKHYHPRAKLASEWHVLTQEFFAGYISPAHPSEGLEYLVVIRARGRSYAFRVTGSGQVLAHSVKEGARTTDLPIPDLFSAEDDVSGRSPQPNPLHMSRGGGPCR